MGSCASNRRRVQQTSELDLRQSCVANTSASGKDRTSTGRKQSHLTLSSQSSLGRWQKKASAVLTVKIALPTQIRSEAAVWLRTMRGIDVSKHCVVMTKFTLKPKLSDVPTVFTFVNPQVEWDELKVRQQVPQELPKQTTDLQLRVFAILEENSSTASNVQIHGKINGERIVIMCSLDEKEVSDPSVHEELFSYLNAQQELPRLCWSCKEKLTDYPLPRTSSRQISNNSRNTVQSEGSHFGEAFRNSTDDDLSVLSRNMVLSPSARGRTSLSSLSTVAQIGSLYNSPVKKCSESSQEEQLQHQLAPQRPLLAGNQPNEQQQHGQHYIVKGTGRKTKIRRPTPISPNVISRPIRSGGKQQVMQVFFEDEEADSSNTAVKEHARSREIATSIDRNRLPSIEGDSRPPSASDVQNKALSPRKLWTPVLENSECEGETDTVEYTKSHCRNVDSKLLSPLKVSAGEIRKKKAPNVDIPLPIDGP